MRLDPYGWATLLGRLERIGLLKVLHVYRVYLPEDNTGIPRVIWNMAEGLLSRGVQSTVLATSGAANGQRQAVDGHSAKLARRLFRIASVDVSLQLLALFRRLTRSADIVHYHFPWPVMDALHLMAPPHCPTVVTYHADIVRQDAALPFYKPLRDRFLASADRIVATSPQYVQTSPVLNQISDGRLRMIPIGIGPRTTPSSELIESWRRRVGKDFILFLGAARYYKGLPILMQAARATEARIVLAGRGTEAAWERGGAPANVTALGAISDADREALIELSLAMVLPSHLRAEAFGVVLLEAARAGKAMITAEIGTGTSYVNIHGVTGTIVPASAPDALAGAMTQLTQNPEQARAFGANALARYQEHFTAERMCAAHFELYEELIAAQPARAA